MPLYVYNTLSKTKEIFKPLEPPLVKIYVCGPTPYDHTHVGHARTYISFDLIRRYLEYKGYSVYHVMNITDIDDKIIRRARELNIEWTEIPKIYTKEFLDVLNKLNIKMPHVMPRVTEHINDIIEFIKVLIDKGYAYESSGSVYFEVDKFPDYGKLSGIAGREEWRQEEDVIKEKKKPYDFALWKKAKPGEPYWDSPWGLGRPGWHIECSVMSSRYLGSQFDIHGGGRDLIFPHHENEIAQSEAYFGVKPWVKYWIHVGYLTIQGEKMSKSLGNIIPVYEVLSKYEPEVLRLYLLSTHYRSPLDFTWEGLEQSKAVLKRLENLVKMVKAHLEELEPPARASKDSREIIESLNRLHTGFFESLDDDFNTTKAMPYLHEFITLSNKYLMEKPEYPVVLKIYEMLVDFNKVLGVLDKHLKPPAIIGEELVRELVKIIVHVRQIHRSRKEYEIADWIRSELSKLGIKLIDKKDKTIWVWEK